MENTSMKATTSIFFHNYYGQHEEWIRFFCEKMHTPFILFYNIVEDSLYNLENPFHLHEQFRQAASGPWLKKIVLRRSPNQGKDIGGKLVLLDAAIRERLLSDYALFLHDKKSPHKIQNREWKEKLFRIIEPGFSEKALATFDKDDTVGIIAGSDSVAYEYDQHRQTFTSHNQPQLTQILADLNITPSDYRYVAGTMFWARLKPLSDFFLLHPPLEVRKTLESGNIMDESGGSNTHAWERLLTWLIFAQGFKMKTL